MVDEDALDSLRTDDGEIVYRRCSTGHHHHLVCRDCGRTVEVEGPAVERWADKVSAEHGFSDVSHTLELFGRCGDYGSIMFLAKQEDGRITRSVRELTLPQAP